MSGYKFRGTPAFSSAVLEGKVFNIFEAAEYLEIPISEFCYRFKISKHSPSVYNLEALRKMKADLAEIADIMNKIKATPQNEYTRFLIALESAKTEYDKALLLYQFCYRDTPDPMKPVWLKLCGMEKFNRASVPELSDSEYATLLSNSNIELYLGISEESFDDTTFYNVSKSAAPFIKIVLGE